jgi:thiol-disulfide isomerase/thioredoxin
MAKYENLPIYRKAMELLVYTEQSVRNFPRYHKYTIGARLRDTVFEVTSLIVNKSVLFAALSVALSACAALPRTDAHTALNQAAETTRGWRLEEGHVGKYLEIPLPGKVTVLDFWAASCAPCIKAMPGLESIWQRVDRDRVLVIGVAIDEDDGLARRSIREKFPVQVTFPMVYDGKAAKLQGIYKVGGKVPSTFVVDKQGRVRFYFDGSDGDMQRLEQAVAVLMDE